MTIITRAGVETLVNTTTTNSQLGPEVFQLGGGKYVIVWTDNVPAGQETPATLPQYPVAFANSDIRGQIFNADGTTAGSEFVVNTTGAGGQLIPQVTLLTDGHFLVSWQDGISTALGGSAPSLSRAQEFTDAGTKVGSEFQITPVGTQGFATSLTAVAGGGFIAFSQQGWASPGATGSIVGQVFDSSNVQVGGPFVVDSTNVSYFSATRAATLSNGNIVVIWDNGPGSGSANSARIYTPAGVAVSGELIVGHGSPGSSGILSVAALVGGGFVVASGADFGTTTTLYADVFSNDGSFVAGDQIASQAQQPGFGADVVALASGGAIISWTNASDGSGSGISAVGYSASGNVIGTPFAVNTQTAGIQRSSSVAVLTNGDFVVAWQDFSATGGDISGTGIRSQRYHVDATNQAPIAVNDSFVALAGFEGFPIDQYLTGNDTDPDGNALTVTSIFNVTGGTVAFDLAAQSFNIMRPNGPNSLIEFDYTISDGNGGTSTAHARLLPDPTDTITVRGPQTIVDFLANDYLVARPEGYQFTLSPPFQTTNMTVSYNLDGAGTATRVLANTGYRFDGAGYAFLPVGQTVTETLQYQTINPLTNTVEGSALIQVTLQGWAQIGGTDADTLIGTAQSDHLVGGTGAANQLTGGAGDDWYTVAAVGDTIIERAGEGFDTVWASVSSFTLPSYTDSLIYVGNAALSFTGTGNELGNVIGGLAGDDLLYGLAGNDRLSGNRGQDQLFGGVGNDILFGGADSDTLDGGAGDDKLNGGTGNDVLRFSGGVDTMNGDDGIDLADYSNFASAVLIDLQAATQYTRGTNDVYTGVWTSIGTVTSVENLKGTSANDSLFGDANNNTIFYTGGLDNYDGRDGVDTLDFSVLQPAVYLDLDAATQYTRDTGNVTSTGAWRALTYTVAASFENAVGTAATDYVLGTAADNVFAYFGGLDDAYFGRGGSDTLDFSRLTNAVYADLNSGVVYDRANTNWNVGGTYNRIAFTDSIENLTGGAGGDYLHGASNVSNRLTGGGGADSFVFRNSGGASVTDTITDFQSGVDKIRLEGFAGLTNFNQLTIGYDAVGAYFSYSGDPSQYVRVLGFSLGPPNGPLTAADFVFFG
jgi:Ca2+-binding RTX toxin-like protein